MIEGKFGDITLCKIDIKELRQSSKIIQSRQKIQKANLLRIEIQQPNFEIINFKQKPIFSYDHIKDSDKFFFDEMKMGELATRNDYFLKNYSEKYENLKHHQKQQQIKQKLSNTTSLVAQQKLQQEFLQGESKKNKNLLSSTWTAPQNNPKNKIFEPTPQEINAILNFFAQKNIPIDQNKAKQYASILQTTNPEIIWKSLQ